MTNKGYNILAVAALVCGMLLGLASILKGAETIDTVALVSVFTGVAGTVVGRGDKDEGE